MKVAIVQEWLTSYAGSEKCITELKDIFPSAPIFTSISNLEKLPDFYQEFTIHNSFLQSFPFAKKKHPIYFFLMPMAFENFDFSDFDVVITSNHACAKGILTNPETLHITYMHTPIRYLWSHYQEYLESNNKISKFLKSALLSYMRVWDKCAIDRVDTISCVSNHVRKRVEKFYRKEAKVIYPPINTKLYSIEKKPTRDYYLMLGRLVKYKRYDLAIETFNQLGLKLKIVGNGPEYKKLKKMAKSNIEFLGHVSDAETIDLYQNCEAFIFPGEEDFGMTPLEVQASGRPVIAYYKGGAKETVVENETGIFFREQTVTSLSETIKSYQRRIFLPEKIRQNALKFDEEVFKKEFYEFVITEYQKFKQK